MTTQQGIMDIAVRVREELERIYGERLREVYLFGSWARGEGDEDSDVDIAVVLDQVPDYLAEIERTSELFCDLGLEADVLVSSVFISEDDFREGRYALHRAIQREGVLV
ncbi:nucleotidyltransferase domain-containing protein [Candidatus Sumerlaeota bacterium]|nr:nucleotidyltransferase domain-containing protein [Candidatus Sumerlaeota bacterium]